MSLRFRCEAKVRGRMRIPGENLTHHSYYLLKSDQPNILKPKNVLIVKGGVKTGKVLVSVLYGFDLQVPRLKNRRREERLKETLRKRD